MNRLFTQPNRRLLIIDDTASIHEDFRKILNPEPSASTELAGLEAALFDAQQQNVAPPYELSFALQAAAAGQPIDLQQFKL